MRFPTKWRCTDRDTFQFGRQTGTRKYEFRQLNDVQFPYTFERVKAIYEHAPYSVMYTQQWEDHSLWSEFEVNLDEYTEEQIRSYIAGFGYTIDGLYKDCGVGTAEWIMAECIFELEL